MLIGQTVGPFEIEKELGSGAMGTVYLARFKGNQRVAIKFMSPSLGTNEKAMQRFEREAEILRQLKHVNIVRYFGHGKYQKTPFYAMEFIEGETIEAILERRGQLPWEEVVSLGQQLCGALQFAHEKGIVHRDLKPSNLMVLPDGTLKLTDFGIAKDLDLAQLTSANCTVGTASYMSPEQCRGEKTIGPKSDLYSLGIVFYELLTGKKPFDAENAMDMFILHCNGKVERPSRLVMDVPLWLDTLVCQMMEKKPEHRPFDARMVSSSLATVAEKVASQRSAGVDVATRRAGDRTPSAARRTSEDEETARTLARAATGRRKRKARPFYKKAWFTAVSIVAALVAVGALLFLTLRPPAAEDLFDEAQKAVTSGDVERIDRVRDGPSGAIHKYLVHYGDRDDDRTKQVRGWADDIDAFRQEKALAIRMKKGITPDDETESAAQQAIRQEDSGEHAHAVAAWQGLLKHKEAIDRESRVYGLIAEKHLRELAAIDSVAAMLLRKVDLARLGQEYKPESEAEAAAAEALRYERFGDFGLAFRKWSALKLKHEKDAENRLWYLLASRQVQELRGRKPPAADEERDRVKMLDERLALAEKLAATKRQEVLLVLHEVRLLYAKQPECKAQVSAADALIAKLGGGP